MVMKHGAHFTLMTNIIVINNGGEDHTKTKSVQYRVSGSTHLISSTTVTCQICFNLNKNLKCGVKESCRQFRSQNLGDVQIHIWYEIKCENKPCAEWFHRAVLQSVFMHCIVFPGGSVAKCCKFNPPTFPSVHSPRLTNQPAQP